MISASSAEVVAVRPPISRPEHALDRGVGVERAGRLGALDPGDLVEHPDHRPAAPVERLAHLGDRGQVAVQGRDRGALGDVVDVGGLVRLQVGGGLDDVGRAEQPAHPPAGHRVGLRDPVDHDAPVREPGHHDGQRGGDGVAVGEVLVDLVGDHPQALVEQPAADRLDLLGAVDGAGRVRRRAEQHRLRAVGQRGLELVDGDLVALGLVGQDLDRHAAREPDRLGVGRPVRRRQQHLVARVEDRREGLVDRLLAAVGDQHLAGRRRRTRSRAASCPRSPA